ncbi:MAG: hypothetical protein AAGH40_13790 [Verrucomicrobiota bacterium]
MKSLFPLLLLLHSSLGAELEIRDASHSPVEGYRESSYTAGKEERKVYLAPEILVTSHDVKDAFTSTSGGIFTVQIEFTNEGARKLEKITKERIRE